MARIFGTDGARGIAVTQLTCERAMDIGRAAAKVLAASAGKPARILVGMDTRISSEILLCALAAGICSMGADAEILGVVPTPAVSYLLKRYGADAGVMISASHNPAEYNGIKLFSSDGCKLPDETEAEIEALILDRRSELLPAGAFGRVIQSRNAVSDYSDYIIQCADIDLSGMRIALDCANGSASICAQRIFSALGAECLMLCDAPDGYNINDGCGSTHLERLCGFVRSSKADVGFAFDGDADRCLACDEYGTPVDGDSLIAILAQWLKSLGRLS
ncbi:MAG: phosphoglucosamine mutase, partial [Oscillospiraceae bacterium]